MYQYPNRLCIVYLKDYASDCEGIVQGIVQGIGTVIAQGLLDYVSAHEWIMA